MKLKLHMTPGNLDISKELYGNVVSRFFLVYLNFNAPDSTLLTFDAERFMYKTYFVKFEFRGYHELKKLD